MVRFKFHHNLKDIIGYIWSRCTGLSYLWSIGHAIVGLVGRLSHDGIYSWFLLSVPQVPRTQRANNRLVSSPWPWVNWSTSTQGTLGQHCNPFMSLTYHFVSLSDFWAQQYRSSTSPKTQLLETPETPPNFGCCISMLVSRCSWSHTHRSWLASNCSVSPPGSILTL